MKRLTVMIIATGFWLCLTGGVTQARVIDLKVKHFLAAYDTIASDDMLDAMGQTTSDDTLLCDEMFIQGNIEGILTVRGVVFFRDATFGGGVDFIETIFEKPVSFRRATFQGYADFIGATFADDVDFAEVTFVEGAEFMGTTFGGNVDFSWADLSETNFELRKPPSHIEGFTNAINLSRMTFVQSPHTLIELRAGFRQAGFRRQEREINYAIHRTLRQRQWEMGGMGILGSTAKYVLVEFPTAWGMAPGRALLILLVLVVVSTIPYLIAIRRDSEDGIWRVWNETRMGRGRDDDAPARIHETGWFRALWIAFYFSLLSALRIGWRGWHPDSWIAQLQAREYTLCASGWVRTVAGLQSLISLYLLVMWVLTRFWRPFE